MNSVGKKIQIQGHLTMHQEEVLYHIKTLFIADKEYCTKYKKKKNHGNSGANTLQYSSNNRCATYGFLGLDILEITQEDCGK